MLILLRKCGVNTAAADLSSANKTASVTKYTLMMTENYFIVSEKSPPLAITPKPKDSGCAQAGYGRVSIPLSPSSLHKDGTNGVKQSHIGTEGPTQLIKLAKV